MRPDRTPTTPQNAQRSSTSQGGNSLHTPSTVLRPAVPGGQISGNPQTQTHGQGASQGQGPSIRTPAPLPGDHGPRPARRGNQDLEMGQMGGSSRAEPSRATQDTPRTAIRFQVSGAAAAQALSGYAAWMSRQAVSATRTAYGRLPPADFSFTADAVKRVGALLVKGAQKVVGTLDDQVYRSDSSLVKHTTTVNMPLYSSSQSKIAAPKTKQEMQDSIYDSLGELDVKPIVAKVPAHTIPADLTASRDPAHQDMVRLARTHCIGFRKRLDAANGLLVELSKGKEGARREALHGLTSSSLKSNRFAAARGTMKLTSGYRDRQMSRVQGGNEALVEHAIATLNLAHETRAYGVQLGTATYGQGPEPVSPGAPGGATSQARADNGVMLHRNLRALRQAQATTSTLLTHFGDTYQSFLTNDLGCTATTTAKLATKIQAVVDPATSPRERNSHHAEIMAVAIADKRLDAALWAASPIDREAIRNQINTLTAHRDPLTADRSIHEFMAELSGNDGLGASEGAKLFLTAFAKQNGAPLDETLRVSRGIYRDAYVPPEPRDPQDPAAGWRGNRAADMEKLNTELMSIAHHVRQARKIGTLDIQLEKLFPGNVDGTQADASVAIKDAFESSFQAMSARAPGDPVTPQDKLNIKIAKCILDHGDAVKDIAKQLKYAQELYAGDLARSPDMMELLRSGATGASYDRNEQRANAQTRLKNLQMSVADAKRSIGHDPRRPRAASKDSYGKALDDADRFLRLHAAALSPQHREAVSTHAFLARNYVRTENAADPHELLRQLGDNDPRCGTDALLSRNLTVYPNLSVAAGAKAANGIGGYAGLDGSYTQQFAAGTMNRSAMPTNVVLTESSAYSLKSICKLQMSSTSGSVKGAGAVSFPTSTDEARAFQNALSLAGSAGVNYERTVYENPEPGLACIVHKSPVLDGTKKNSKISTATYLEMNDAVNRALFRKPEVADIEPVSSTMEGWDNLNQFLAATDRAGLEQLTKKKEVTVTWTAQGGASLGGSESTSFGEGRWNGALSFRQAPGFEGKTSHSFREEVLETSHTLEKVTTSDTLSATVSGSFGASMRLGATVSVGGGTEEAAHMVAQGAAAVTHAAIQSGHVPASIADPLKRAADAMEGITKTVSDNLPKVRITTNVDLLKVIRATESNRDYDETYRRIVRDQFHVPVASLVRYSRTATDGRLLVDSVVNDVGLATATIAQRLNEGTKGAPPMSPLEKHTLTQLLLVSAVASHYENAGEVGQGQPKNENLTINVTASLSPAAAARHAALSAGFGQLPAGTTANALQQDLLGNSLNYATLGASGGFKNQDVDKTVYMVVAKNRRTTSSAQSAGYPSGVDVLTREKGEAFRDFLRQKENKDIRDALQSVGLGSPVELLDAYERIQPPPSSTATTSGTQRSAPANASMADAWVIGDEDLGPPTAPETATASAGPSALAPQPIQVPAPTLGP